MSNIGKVEIFYIFFFDVVYGLKPNYNNQFINTVARVRKIVIPTTS